jgi:predicted nucleotidyltransferase
VAAGAVLDLPTVTSILRDYTPGRPEIEAVWLFGSQRRQDARSTSDLDLALQVRPRPPVEREIADRAEWARELEARLRVSVDVVLLSPELPLPLLWEIVGHPAILYEKYPGVGASYGAYLRALCRDQWARLERRWERTRRWLTESQQNAPTGHP